MNRNLYAGAAVVVGRRVELDLRGQVGAGVLLLVRRQRGELGVAQVEPGVGVVDALRDRLAVVGAGEHSLGLLAHHDRGAGVLAHRQHAAGGDVDVLQQVERDEPVVAGRLGVVDDPPQLGQVGRAQVVRDVVHRLGGEQPDRLGRDLQEGPSTGLERRDPSVVSRRYGVVVGADRQQVGVVELGGATGALRLTGPRLVQRITLTSWQESSTGRTPCSCASPTPTGTGWPSCCARPPVRVGWSSTSSTQRLEATYAAKTYADLVPITMDLPGHHESPRLPARVPRRQVAPATTPARQLLRVDVRVRAGGARGWSPRRTPPSR